MEICKPGVLLIVRNAKIDMFRTSMRLAIDQWGKIETADDLDVVPNVSRGLICPEMQGRLSPTLLVKARTATPMSKEVCI